MLAPSPFGIMLRQTREAAKLSQSELAAELKKTAQYISNIEKGKNNSPPEESDLQLMIKKLRLADKDSERFRLLAYADRGMLPPEIFNYIYDCPELINLIQYGISGGLSADYWSRSLQNINKAEKGTKI